MVNAVLDLKQPIPHDEVMRIINAQIKPKEKTSMFNFFSSTTTEIVSNTAPVSKTDPRVVTFNHTSGTQSFTFSIPGIDPKVILIMNKDRKINIFNEAKIMGVINTYDQIDVKEVTATYKFGQLIITITPNTDKFKEYEIKIVT